MCILASISEPNYGRAIRFDLEQKGIEVDEATLYSTLHKLERKGLLESAWDIKHKVPRRYYRMTTAGRLHLPVIAGAWKQTVGAVRIVREAP